MTVRLTGNFLQNTRGITFADGGGITWSLDSSTNAITADGSSAGAGAANPTVKVGLTTVNGSADTWMRSDGAPPLDLSISPTWTGTHGWTQSVAGAFNTYVTNSSNGSASSVLWRLRNDASHDFQLALTSSLYSGPFLTGGPSGEQCVLYSNNGIPLVLGTSSTARLVITINGVVAIPDSNGVFYAVGYLGLPNNTQNAAYTFALSDRGKMVQAATTVALTYSIPASVFSVGDLITIVNNNTSGHDVTLHADDGMTLYWYNGSSQVSGDRTIAVGGTAQIVCVAASYFYVLNGIGIS